MEIQTSDETITLNKSDKENIIKGLAILIEIYTDNLKETIKEVKLNKTMSEYENSIIDRCVKEIKSINDTLMYFYEKEAGNVK